MTSNDLLIDKRIVQRNIEQGKLDTAEYQKMLDALPDLSDKVWRRTDAAPSASVVKKPAAHGIVAQYAPEHTPASPALGQASPPRAGFETAAFGQQDDAIDDELDDDDDDDELDDDELDDEGDEGDEGGEETDSTDAGVGQD